MHALLHLFCMASSAVTLREGNRAVTCAAVFAGKQINHAVLFRTFLDPDKYVRMAEFAAVPDGMFLMREDDLRNPFNFDADGKILLIRHLAVFLLKCPSI